MIKYRIKTQEEFIEKFGKNWRHIILCGWIEDMDHLFDKEIPDIIAKQIITDSYSFIINEVCMFPSNWKISIDMIIENKKTPNYNPKILSHEI
jgi:hypothetical protein